MPSRRLTSEQVQHWRDKGFLVVPGVLSRAEAAAHAEELAKPPPQSAAAAGLNRHAVDPAFGRLATHEVVVDVVRQLLEDPTEAPRILQTMYLLCAIVLPLSLLSPSLSLLSFSLARPFALRPPHTTPHHTHTHTSLPVQLWHQPVPWSRYLNKTPDVESSRLGIALHQDTHYIPNTPNTLLACWLALTDTDEANGGLFVVPGTHRGPLLSEGITVDDTNHGRWEMVHKMRDRDGTEWEQPFHSVDVTAAGFDASQAVALRVPAGSAVFFTGMTVHGSYKNVSDTPRRAFATHYMDSRSWVSRCDLQKHLSSDEVVASLFSKL